MKITEFILAAVVVIGAIGYSLYEVAYADAFLQAFGKEPAATSQADVTTKLESIAKGCYREIDSLSLLEHALKGQTLTAESRRILGDVVKQKRVNVSECSTYYNNSASAAKWKGFKIPQDMAYAADRLTVVFPAKAAGTPNRH